MPPTDDESPAVDRPVLEYVRDHLRGLRQFETVRLTDDGHLALRATLSGDYYPGETTATLTVRWFRNDDFGVHYREQRADGRWECRWDRHPNTHNDRDHYHPPPDALTPGEDDAWPTDYRDVLGLVIDEIESRIETLWDR